MLSVPRFRNHSSPDWLQGNGGFESPSIAPPNTYDIVDPTGWSSFVGAAGAPVTMAPTSPGAVYTLNGVPLAGLPGLIPAQQYAAIAGPGGGSPFALHFEGLNQSVNALSPLRASTPLTWFSAGAVPGTVDAQ